MGTAVELVVSGVVLALMVYSIILHEIGHAYSAFLLGDDTAKVNGRLSLNPLVHIDPVSTLIIPLFCFVATQGRFVIGGAKPVPVNPLKLRNPARDRVLTAISGPAVNLGLAIVFALLTRALAIGTESVNFRFHYILYRAGLLNIVLLVFNMIPIPPLDGSRVLRYFLGPHGKQILDSMEYFGLMFVMVFLLMLNTLFQRLLYPFWYVYDLVAIG